MGHHHEHHHAHGHNHSHDGHSFIINEKMGVIYIWSIVLNLLFVAVETAVGIWSGSMGLISDAGHNLSDVLALGLALLAFYLIKRSGEDARRKASWIAFINALLLAVAIAVIVWESVEKLLEANAEALDGSVISWTAGVGILINGVTTYMLSRGNKADLNNRGAYLHMLADTLVSVGVVVSGIVIYYTGCNIVDTIVSIVIAIVLVGSCYGLIKDTYEELRS